MKLHSAALIVGWFCFYASLVLGDVGTATSYDPPYRPTKCNGYSRDQFPEDGLFAAAGNGVWDNGAACGRKYRMRCLSGLMHPCKQQTIVVEIVDACRRNPCPSTLVLSDKAHEAISSIPGAKINVEYAQ